MMSFDRSKYLEVLDWLYVQIPNFQRQGKVAYKPDLRKITAILHRLGNPQKNISSIHVAGTNGKGSTAHLLASVLQSAGFKVGLYTSPHLIDFRERIKINGQCIPKKNVLSFIEKYRDFFQEVNASFFEITVAMAFDFFSDEHIDVAVVEVGLGGRLDATNIINPLVSIITNIGLDHTAFLGDTLAAIASEKAGVIKANTPVIIGQYHSETFPVFVSHCQKLNAPLYKAFEEKNMYTTDLKGSYQKYNLKTALTTLNVLKKQGYQISSTAIKKGFLSVVAQTGLRGRWEQISNIPKIICDTAHNREGLFETLTQLKNESAKKIHIVLGFVADKNMDEMLPLFPVDALYYFAAPSIKRALPVEILYQKAHSFGLKGTSYDTVFQAFISAKTTATKDDFVYVGGSTFVVAEVLEKEKND